ncbi:MAG: glycosyltransferase, partial [Lachnospiraceae bacterium]|nr:glycosyltransferase [Lachnospiraceae bacterium]
LLVSVIVAIYNVGEYLEQCIESVISQTEKNIEIILVDDGSTDNSADICDRYAAEDARIRVIHQANAGVSAARNAGIEAANADWVMFVDGDDWLTPDAVEILYGKAKSDDNCDVFVGSFYYNYPDVENFAGVKVAQETKYEYDLSAYRREIISYILGQVEIPELLQMKSNLTSPWAKIYRRKLLVSNKIFYVPGQKKAQDQVFNLYVAQYARKIIVVNEPVYHYRIWENSISLRLASNKVSLDVYAFWNKEVLKFFAQLENGEPFEELYNLYVFRRVKEISYIYFGAFLSGNGSYKETVKKISNAISSIYCREGKLGKSRYVIGTDKIIFILLRQKNYFLLRFVWKFRAILKKAINKRQGISL